MKTPRSIISLFAGLFPGTGMGLVSLAQAGDVTVTEGETATFQITVTRTAATQLFSRDSRVRVYYASDGGTATPGSSNHGVGVDHE